MVYNDQNILVQGGYCLIRASAQMMIQMMDRNGDGKLAKNEVGGMDFDSMLAQADLSTVKQYVPDIEKLIKKVKFSLIMSHKL